MNKELIIIGVIGVVLLIGYVGLPDEIEIFGLKWEIKGDKQEITRDITIKKFETRQKIYSLGETATVDFVIKNTRNHPYNFTVEWFHNNTRYHGWFNVSTERYDTTEEDNSYYSWYPVKIKGDWEVQLVLRYTIQNHTFSKDAITSFRVI